MADVIRIDKVLSRLLSEFKEVEIAERQKIYHSLCYVDDEYKDKWAIKDLQAIEEFKSKSDRDVLEYALLSAIHNIKARNQWQ